METIETELPRYFLIKPFYADETYFDAESEIEFDGIPNEFMQPLNDPAREAMLHFIESLTEVDPATGITPGLEAQIDKASPRATAHKSYLSARGGGRREITPIIPDTVIQSRLRPGEVPVFQEDIPPMVGTTIDGRPAKKRLAVPKTANLIPVEQRKYKPPKKVFGSVITDTPTPQSI